MKSFNYSDAYVLSWLRPYTKHKLEPRYTECVFCGYSMAQFAYKFLEPTTNKIYVSRHVRFVPHIFPFTTRRVLLEPRKPTTSLPTMSWQPVPLADLRKQDVSPDLPQQDVSLDLPYHHPLQQ
ncbi:hypothetical protein V6N12_045289 [Hibiscus sabdariffa]|uniref:Retroviral polymerase SH3-like domain-containing protein n=1 Tax=Hibiscus sabdariffa TaxID=183260 RepID=A0ABR2G2B2_9ROSI